MTNETKAKEKTQIAPVAPAAQLPSKREAWATFQDDLNKRADEIGSQLPSNVSRERFLGASMAAVKANPQILTATPRSLMAALTKAAQDGLLPDGREGIITVYSQKIPNTAPQQYENVAQWNPMFYGIRKRARELDGIIIDAQVVFAGDEFDYELGDSPFIKHKPKARTEAVDASAGVAVYAIFRHPEQGILHREVMWKPEVFATMNQSRAKSSLMWTTFWTEGWRKAVGRRGSKSVPVSAQLERLIQRDDENFDFSPTPAKVLPPPIPDDEPPHKPEPKAEPSQDFNDDASFINGTPPSADEIVATLDDDLSYAMTPEAVEEAFDAFDAQTKLAGNDKALTEAFALKEKHIARASKAKPKAEQTDFFPPDVP